MQHWITITNPHKTNINNNPSKLSSSLKINAKLIRKLTIFTEETDIIIEFSFEKDVIDINSNISPNALIKKKYSTT